MNGRTNSGTNAADRLIATVTSGASPSSALCTRSWRPRFHRMALMIEPRSWKAIAALTSNELTRKYAVPASAIGSRSPPSGTHTWRGEAVMPKASRVSPAAVKLRVYWPTLNALRCRARRRRTPLATVAAACRSRAVGIPT